MIRESAHEDPMSQGRPNWVRDEILRRCGPRVLERLAARSPSGAST